MRRQEVFAIEDYSPDLQLGDFPHGVMHRNALPRALMGFLAISMAVTACSGGGGVATPTSRREVVQTPLVLAPPHTPPTADNATEVSPDSEQALFAHLRETVDRLPDSSVKKMTKYWIDLLFANPVTDPHRDFVMVSDQKVPLGSPDIRVTYHEDLYSHGYSSIRELAPDETDEGNNWLVYSPSEDTILNFPLPYRTDPDVIPMRYRKTNPFSSGIAPLITLEIPGPESGLNPQEIQYLYDLTLIKEAISISLMMQFMSYDTQTMTAYDWPTTVTTTSGDAVEVLTSSTTALMGNHGQLQALLDETGWVLTLYAIRDDPTLMGTANATPQFRQIASKVTSMDLEDNDANTLILVTMRLVLADSAFDQLPHLGDITKFP